MGKFIDITGKRFGRLLVIEKSGYDDWNEIKWKCKCDCGRIKDIIGRCLRDGTIRSCGCYKAEKLSKTKIVDITGRKFGRLTVISLTDKRRIHEDKSDAIWRCRCDCGKEVDIVGGYMRSGNTKSCGCLQKESISGENNYNWRGGVSGGYYSKDWKFEFKEYIRNRDGRKCQYPNCNHSDVNSKERLSVHHIDGNKKNSIEWNLISLCRKHHCIIEHTNPKEWEPYFYKYTESFII